MSEEQFIVRGTVQSQRNSSESEELACGDVLERSQKTDERRFGIQKPETAKEKHLIIVRRFWRCYRCPSLKQFVCVARNMESTGVQPSTTYVV